MKEYQISIFNSSTISDVDLDSHVREITNLFPRCGEKTVCGRLRSCDIRVPRQRLRESLHRVDPSGIISHCKGMLHRRKYQVPCPNALWHIDGYHKLVRWRFIIHGGIDGYSRLITYLKVATNNQSSTVLNAFIQAVQEFGLPSRVRMDRGGENIEVVRYMLNHVDRGPGRGSAITGCSTHNQHVQLLDVDDPRDMYALHFVFVSVIQRHLDLFRSGWAQHSIRTEHSKTPTQLWIAGLHQTQHEEVITGLTADWDNYGIDWDGPVPLVKDYVVQVAEVSELLTHDQKAELQQQLNDLDLNLFSQVDMLRQFVPRTLAYLRKGCVETCSNVMCHHFLDASSLGDIDFINESCIQ
uniref:Integrase catalytic domain-containing protein n=1 Tax=Amphimedon queenslandica TaxID=400682 RepID=A0A1X7SXX9_AMPQE